MAEALTRTVAERGLAGTKIADVAAEAGVSVGLVQSYFRTKNDLLRFGIRHIYERGTERALALSVEPPVRNVLLRLLETFLPLDQERRDEFAVWLEFVPVSARDADMHDTHLQFTEEMTGAVTRALEAARERGELAEHLDPRQEALGLVTQVDGLAMHQLATAEVFDADTARAVLTRAVDRLFDGESR